MRSVAHEHVEVAVRVVRDESRVAGLERDIPSGVADRREVSLECLAAGAGHVHPFCSARPPVSHEDVESVVRVATNQISRERHEGHIPTMRRLTARNPLASPTPSVPLPLVAGHAHAFRVRYRHRGRRGSRSHEDRRCPEHHRQRAHGHPQVRLRAGLLVTFAANQAIESGRNRNCGGETVRTKSVVNTTNDHLANGVLFASAAGSGLVAPAQVVVTARSWTGSGAYRDDTGSQRANSSPPRWLSAEDRKARRRGVLSDQTVAGLGDPPDSNRPPYTATSGGTRASQSALQAPSASLAISLLALFISLGGASFAATGGNFVLGQSNTATSGSTLTANVPGKETLTLKNTNTSTSSTALNLNVAAGRPPFTTNSAIKVANLNADKLDGLDATSFLGVGDTAANSNLLDGLDSTDFLGVAAKAADSDCSTARTRRTSRGSVGASTATARCFREPVSPVSHLGEGEYQVSFPAGTLSNTICPPIVVAIPFAGVVRHPRSSDEPAPASAQGRSP